MESQTIRSPGIGDLHRVCRALAISLVEFARHRSHRLRVFRFLVPWKRVLSEYDISHGLLPIGFVLLTLRAPETVGEFPGAEPPNSASGTQTWNPRCCMISSYAPPILKRRCVSPAKPVTWRPESAPARTAPTAFGNSVFPASLRPTSAPTPTPET